LGRETGPRAKWDGRDEDFPIMTIGAMGGTLRHLRDLFQDGTTLGVGDGQLLARYATARDEAAFEALVARHGPMVLATCRAVLRHEHDVEDAFQATFLVLARKARSVRAGDALGGWLHRVAYRAAVHAGAASRRRRRREAEAAAVTTVESVRRGPEPDIAPIVHEELDRLPDRERLPVVLCDLEGLTYEQAAGQLRWTEPTLRHRLVKGRHRLRDRLTRRGVTAGAVGIVLAGTTTGARAAVPPALARAALMAATGGTASVAAATLSTTLIRSMAMTKLKIAAAGLLAAAGLASIGVVAIGSGRPDPPRAAVIPQAAGEMKRPAAAGNNPAPAPAPAESGRLEVRGRVVKPDGKPVAGAAVRTAYLDLETDPAPEATSGPDGRFTMQVPPWRRNSAMGRSDGMFPWVVAWAPGFGPGWVSAVRQPGAPDETTIRLAEDGPPIEGRILDLEGRPVVGARVKLERIWLDREGRLSAWLDRARDGGARGPWQGLDSLPSTIETATGPDGRFRLTGIGRDRLAELLVSGPTITTAQLYVANRDGTPIRTPDPNSMILSRPSWTTYHTRRFDYAAAPAQPIEGFIRDKDTGQPIAGVKLRGMVFEENSLVTAPGVEATSDALGHYRLGGLPRANAYRLFTEPGRGQPYTKGTFRTPGGSPALEPVAFDIALKRGVLVRGRVTDKATGRPVSGYVNAYTFDNPHVGEFPGYRDSYEAYVRIDDDGRYEIVTLPGRGIIACRSDLGRYLGGVGAAAIKGFDPKLAGVGGFATLPHYCDILNYHVVAEVNPDPKAESTTLDLQVDPGRSLTIRVEDPDGHPLGGTKASGLTDLFGSHDYPQDSPAIEIHALDPSKPRRVTVTHEGRKLVGSVYLKGDESGPMTLRLQPWGTVTGRAVDEDGEPRKGLRLYNRGGIYPPPPADSAILPQRNFGPDLVVDPDGRFRVEGLVPGLKYGATGVQGITGLGDVFRDITVAPGEVKDLGDVKVVKRL
jgi:RNA polymerase sigma factor (sigma-70 family)